MRPPRKAETLGSIQTEEPEDGGEARATWVPAKVFAVGISTCFCPVMRTEGAEKPQEGHMTMAYWGWSVPLLVSGMLHRGHFSGLCMSQISSACILYILS